MSAPQIKNNVHIKNTSPQIENDITNNESNDLQTNIIHAALANISDAWLKIINHAAGTNMDRFKAICSQINMENVTPSPDLWFEWARLTPLDSIKVIIIGQDPYPGIGIAHGLAFSSLGLKLPGSLKNIYKCLQKCGEINDYKNTTADLTSWAEQGVLLFNIAMSTEISKSGAHLSIWHKFTRRILGKVFDYHEHNNLIILSWGNAAQKYIDKFHGYYTLSKYFTFLTWCHPSPLTGKKFIDCDHFTKVNALLISQQKSPIQWNSIENIPSITETMGSKSVIELIASKSTTKLIAPKSEIQIIFTDGSAVSKGKNRKDKHATGGYATVFVSGPIADKVLLGKLDTSIEFASNIRAEGMAIIAALENCFAMPEHVIIEIYTDSDFWIKMIEVYMPNWEKKNIDFNSKENTDLTTRLWKLWKEITINHTVKLIHVYAHNKSGWMNSSYPHERFCYDKNNLADKLAEMARTKLQDGEEIWRNLRHDDN